MAPNKSFVYKKVPDGAPVPGEHIVVEDRPIDLDAAPPSGGLVVEVLYASYDPYLRVSMRDPAMNSHSGCLKLDEPIPNGVIARVLKTDSAEWAQGDQMWAFLPIAQYAVVQDPKAVHARKLHNPRGLDTALFLGPLGMPGITAWSGLYRIGKPKAGETIFVSSAAGAVGQVVGEIAKREGLKVIGSVGSDEKLDFITKELGFDAGFNYKKESVFDALPRLAPQGIDINFENVGGDHLEAAILNMNKFGRVPLCGMIEGYNVPREKQKGIRFLMEAVYRGITIQGFLQAMPDFAPAYFQEHQDKMQQWLADGDFKARMHVTEGIDNACDGFMDMLEGRNMGKAVLKL